MKSILDVILIFPVVNFVDVNVVGLLQKFSLPWGLNEFCSLEVTISVDRRMTHVYIGVGMTIVK